MRKIEAIIRPHKLDEVKEALGSYGIHGMTVSQVFGCGLQRGRIGVYRGQEYSINLLPKVKVEVVVRDHLADEVVRIICDVSRTGEIGDGKIFISTIEDVVRIRTGEKGNAAL
ncbi:MAG: P-II family nitrogen regulator [Peptococcaceae bacterium]|nr:P-II family nitrogen regulator [Peptococcaceae bacterium]